jgi:hypothetical protein
MAPFIDRSTLCVALILAAAAAVLSTPGETDHAYQTLHWLMASVGQEAADLAGAIGENPEITLAP